MAANRRTKKSSEAALVAALADNQAALDGWEKIGSEGRRTYVAWIDRAKGGRRRESRIQEIVSTLALSPFGTKFQGSPGDGLGPNGISM